MKIPELLVFDPALCCSTGVCGPEPNPVLPRFAADLEWRRARGVPIRRFNLAREPQAFAEHEPVWAALQQAGTDWLPFLLLGDRVVARGRYPSRGEMAGWTGVPGASPDVASFGGFAGGCDPDSGCC